MKKIMLVFLVFVLVNSLFADPFGLKMGMTLDEISEKCIDGKNLNMLVWVLCIA